MSDGDALLAAVLADPADDVPRLVYADWLDENGQEERAEFIRVQCRIATLEAESGHPKTTPLAWSCKCDVCEEAKPLRRRERELLAAHVRVWTDGLPDPLVTKLCPACIETSPDWETGVVECRRCDSTGVVEDYDSVEFRRGFVAEVSLALADFVDHAGAIFAAHPVERVTLTDRKPYDTRSLVRQWAWVSASNGLAIPGDDRTSGEVRNPARLPAELHAIIQAARTGLPLEDSAELHIAWYDSKASALAALSAACVAYGRELAGLSALPFPPAKNPA